MQLESQHHRPLLWICSMLLGLAVLATGCTNDGSIPADGVPAVRDDFDADAEEAALAAADDNVPVDEVDDTPLVVEPPPPSRYPGGLDPAPSQVSPTVKSAIDEAREAMARRDLLPAGDALRDAQQKFAQPGTADAREIQRNRLVYRSLLRFWGAVRTGKASLKTGQLLKFDGAEAAVVELDGNRLVIEIAGRDRRELSLVRSKMPPELALALAHEELERLGPVADRIRATFHLRDAAGNRQTAAELCEAMYQQGLDVDSLVSEL